jgi:tetratricopeptide (TPR) repeat protein
MKRLLLAALLASSASAHAQSDPQAEARALYAEGKRFFDLAEYDKAIDSWKRAYVLDDAPMLLFNIGQAYRLGGDCASALRFYANYEREQPNPPNADELALARTRCNPQPTTVVPPPPPPDPPEPKRVAAIPASPDPDLDDKAPGVTAPKPVRHHGHLRTVSYVTVAGGAALLGVAAYLGARAQDHADEVASYHGAWGPEQVALESAGKTDATWAAISAVTGVAAVAAGGTLFYLSVTHDRAEVAWRASF